ncbi:PREDICTED: uncharacterized protein LOC106821448 [Priapulus caudatus]|uniref:Uncharacterized protein LOC106821448 n=1 Tax=Priapulus caudatus TaxID=37621 RepID=A0ABM1FBC6_PRICU|nr:PREDICTED: uncharacterized protein LOC106821448 [Priapulus caudatus]
MATGDSKQGESSTTGCLMDQLDDIRAEELVREVLHLRESLHQAAVAVMRSQKKLQIQKTKTRRLIDSLQRNDAITRAMSLEHDKQMQDVTSKLIFLQSKIRKDQAAILMLLEKKDEIISTQQQDLLQLRKRVGAEVHNDDDDDDDGDDDAFEVEPARSPTLSDKYSAHHDDSGLENSGEGELLSAHSSLSRETTKSVSFYFAGEASSGSGSGSPSGGDSGDSATGSLERCSHKLSPVSEVETPTDGTPLCHDVADADAVITESIERLKLGCRGDKATAAVEKTACLPIDRVSVAKNDLLPKNGGRRPLIHALASQVTDDDADDTYIVANFEPGVTRNKSVKTVREVKHRNRDKMRAKTLPAADFPIYATEGMVHYV